MGACSSAAKPPKKNVDPKKKKKQRRKSKRRRSLGSGSDSDQNQVNVHADINDIEVSTDRNSLSPDDENKANTRDRDGANSGDEADGGQADDDMSAEEFVEHFFQSGGYEQVLQLLDIALQFSSDEEIDRTAMPVWARDIKLSHSMWKEVAAATLSKITKHINAKLKEDVGSTQIQSQVFTNVIKAMKQFRGHVSLHVNSLKLLWRACSSPELSRTLAFAGAIDTIIESMKTHPTSTVLQLNGAGAIANLSILPSNKKAVVVLDGMQVLADAMATHYMFSKPVEEILRAIATVALDDAAKQKFGTAKVLWYTEDGKANGADKPIPALSALLRVMNQNISHPGVQQQGCAAIRNLIINNPRNKRIISNEHGLTSVISAVVKHEKDMKVCFAACSAMRNIVAHNDTDKLRMLPNGLMMLKKIMKDSHKEKILNLQREAVGCLRNLCAHPQVKKDVVREGLINPVINLMKNHQQSAELQEQCCVVLFNLCSVEGAASEMVDEGALSQVMLALSTFVMGSIKEKSKGESKARVVLHPELIEEACGFLWKIARSSAKYQAYNRGGEGIMDEILALVGRAKDNYRQNPGIQKYALGMRRSWMCLKQEIEARERDSKANVEK